MSYPAANIPSNCPYGIKSVKTFRGHDGDGYEATITLNGKPQFIAVDDGWGGGLQFHDIKPGSRLSDAAVKAMDTYAKTLPNYPSDDLFPEGLSMSGELLIEELVNIKLEEKNREKNVKRFQKFCTTETLFRLKGDKKGSWRTLKLLRTDPRVDTYLAKNCAGKVECILNDLMATDPYAWEKF